ncbi:uncharacterized protein M421DRAFT_95146 [Didymella exigua CBS 183.55]|uniref:Uncharacterized protein n=1 Tax=Didymella exigua CBS 183.55 TaxID=1150837 RepID=A0A6A5RCJ6_9PLEO|nr:uncharacterized protein M421DRAFT_95146 [Didymella exigua CBS 183.55]KAF1924804.1 hypothetical protein M421DRAFT_95146 [Didymella exigua CBS 183.55]
MVVREQYFEADLSTHIQEAFGHEQYCSNGTIFRNIQRYHQLADEGNKKKWWARLSASKKRGLKQLLKDRRFVNTFDSLINSPGLWPPVQLGTLHRQYGLHCTKEMISYLEHVRDVWHTMIPQDCCEFVDEYTAQQLEMLAPAMSRSDNNTDKRSLWQSFQAIFFQPERLQVQLSDKLDDLKVLSTTSSDQLQMFCFRHFPEMTPIKPRLEARNSQQATQRPINPSLMPQLARLAVRLGFQTDKVMALTSKDPERLAVEEFIRSARLGHREDVSDHVLAIKHILTQISDLSQPMSGPEFLGDQSVLIERRCG